MRARPLAAPTYTQRVATSSGKRTVRPVAAQPRAISIGWRYCLLGLVVGEILLFILGDGGLALANRLWGNSGGIDGGIVGTASLLAVMAGAYLAARLAGRCGIWQGIVVGIGFIAVSAVFQFVQEAVVVHQSLTGGGNVLVDLGPMDMGSLMSGDLLALVGGTIGGLLSGKR